MFMNLTDVLTKEDKVVSTQVDPNLDQVVIAGECYRILSHTPVSLTMTNLEKGKAKLEGKVEFVFQAKCDRCLKPVDEKLEISFERVVYAPERIADIPDEQEDECFMDGYQLDVEELLNNEIVINWPMKILCRPDCKGICRQCGQDLNTGTCDCDSFVPDPRMAVIKDIFNANKEV